jgi:hypothetical protein
MACGQSPFDVQNAMHDPQRGMIASLDVSAWESES